MNLVFQPLLESGRTCVGNIFSESNEVIHVSTILSSLMGTCLLDDTANVILSSETGTLKKFKENKKTGSEHLDIIADILRKYNGTSSKL